MGGGQGPALSCSVPLQKREIFIGEQKPHFLLIPACGQLASKANSPPTARYDGQKPAMNRQKSPKMPKIEKFVLFDFWSIPVDLQLLLSDLSIIQGAAVAI